MEYNLWKSWTISSILSHDDISPARFLYLLLMMMLLTMMMTMMLIPPLSPQLNGMLPLTIEGGGGNTERQACMSTSSKPVPNWPPYRPLNRFCTCASRDCHFELAPPPTYRGAGNDHRLEMCYIRQSYPHKISCAAS